MSPNKSKKCKEADDLNEIHCGSCGRFLGYELVIEGIIRMLCPKCKGWTEICQSKEGMELDKL